MSRFLDVSGTVDKKQKESTPKGYAWRSFEMGSYQILGRSAKVQDAYDVRILRPARQPVFFYFTVATFLTKKNAVRIMTIGGECNVYF